MYLLMKTILVRIRLWFKRNYRGSKPSSCVLFLLWRTFSNYKRSKIKPAYSILHRAFLRLGRQEKSITLSSSSSNISRRKSSMLSCESKNALKSGPYRLKSSGSRSSFSNNVIAIITTYSRKIIKLRVVMFSESDSWAVGMKTVSRKSMLPIGSHLCAPTMLTKQVIIIITTTIYSQTAACLLIKGSTSSHSLQQIVVEIKTMRLTQFNTLTSPELVSRSICSKIRTTIIRRVVIQRPVQLQARNSDGQVRGRQTSNYSTIAMSA